MVQRESISNLPPEPRAARRLNAAEIESLANECVSGGAILTLPGRPVSRFLVGHLAWIDAQRIFWFTAYGDSTADGHVLEFDDARMDDASAITFLKGGCEAGFLTSITQSGVDDPDDYRIAWQLWQEVAPLRGRLIAAVYSALVGSSAAADSEHTSVGAIRS